MGIVSWVSNKIKDGYKNAVDLGTRVCNRICAAVTAVAGYVSGEHAKRISEKAKEVYEKAKVKYDSKHKEFEETCMVLTQQINKNLSSINEKKEFIISTLFVKLQKVLSKIKYEKKFCLEHLKINTVNIGEICFKNDIILIDFEKNPIKSRLKAIISLGIWATKQAEKSLEDVQNEVHKIEEKIKLMEGEVIRLKNINNAVQQINGFITEMIKIYERILYKAMNSANYLRFKCMQFTYSVSEEYCKLGALPKADQELLSALFNLSVILDRTSKMNIMFNEDTNELTNIVETFEEQKNSFVKFAA